MSGPVPDWAKVSAIAAVVGAAGTLVTAYYALRDHQPIVTRVARAVAPVLPYTPDRVSRYDEVADPPIPPEDERSPDVKDPANADESVEEVVDPEAENPIQAQEPVVTEARTPLGATEVLTDVKGEETLLADEPIDNGRTFVPDSLLVPVQLHWRCPKSQVRLAADDILLDKRDYGRRIAAASDLVMLRVPLRAKWLRVWGLSRKGSSYRESALRLQEMHVAAIEIHCDPKDGGTKHISLKTSYRRGSSP